MLTGILTPTSGTCTINGRNPAENRKSYVKEIGVVFGQRTQLWWDLPLRETYGVLKEIYEVPDDRYHKQMAFLNEVLELDSFITSPVRTLSLGQRIARRYCSVAFAQSKGYALSQSDNRT